MEKKQGMVYVFEGKGKGKTSAALGCALRMLLLGKRVEWVSWFKERSWQTAEMKLVNKFDKTLKMHWMGGGFLGGEDDNKTFEEHKKKAVEAINLSFLIVTKGTDLLVMDEVIKAVNEKLVDVKEVIEIIKMRGKTHIILTGHDCPEEIVEMADLVTKMVKIKHPYDKGVLAVSGLDF
jgi:cob(I)alamin adenosyltransferase